MGYEFNLLFIGDTVLIAENESDLQKLVSVFNSVCKRRKLKVNVNKNKVMVCEILGTEVPTLNSALETFTFRCTSNVYFFSFVE